MADIFLEFSLVVGVVGEVEGDVILSIVEIGVRVFGDLFEIGIIRMFFGEVRVLGLLGSRGDLGCFDGVLGMEVVVVLCGDSLVGY